ncbi:MAG: transcription termination factor NusA [Candidatus Zambryskibacteria bacterium]|nr:transcription termination factor NusA [Candidatus Zambryskibacteria bacterium]
MFDLKVIHSVLTQLEEERGIPQAKIIEAIELALATAYKKEYGKKGQIVRAKFDLNSGGVEMYQVKVVVDSSTVLMELAEDEDLPEGMELYNPEHHMLISDAKLIKKGIELGEEMVFPLEDKADYGRIAAQTAKQVIMQKIREAEKVSILAEYGAREGEIVTGSVQRIERGNIFVDLSRAPGLLSYEEQIPGERYGQGERVRAYLYKVEDSGKGVFLRLSRSHPKFLEKLFETEAPELATGAVVVKSIAREAGSRTKIAVASTDDHIDPVGSMVGQRGVRVATVMSELGGEKIDIIEWNEDPKKFIEEALSPAKILSIEINETEKSAKVAVSPDQQSLAIGKGGQNVRLAAKLTGWRIDIQSDGSAPAGASPAPEVIMDSDEGFADISTLKSEEVAEAPVEEVKE